VRKLSVPYGNEEFEITLAEKNILDAVYPKETQQRNSEYVLAHAIEKPVGKQTLRAFLGTRERLLCIVNDATRPTKTSAVLDAMKEEIDISNIQFLVATGAHRAPTAPELRMIFGEFYGQHRNRILIHDARDDNSVEYFGKTRYGNELWLNKALKQYDRILVIGSVEPHYFAGFTGGRKAILPGVAAYRTIEQNHKFATHFQAQSLNIIDNPIHDEMIDCVRIFDNKELFSLQMVLDRNQDIYDAYTGSIDRTFEMAARVGEMIYRTTIKKKTDVVVTVAQWPFDIDLYQTLKAIEHGRMAVKEGGILLVVSPCHEGLGPRNFARLFDSPESIEEAVNSARISYRLGDHNAINLARLRQSNEIWAITHIPDSILERAQIKKCDSLQHALDLAIEKKGQDAEVLFLMNGSLTVPDIA
jgi:nickel-dependent lactate racemase